MSRVVTVKDECRVPNWVFPNAKLDRVLNKVSRMRKKLDVAEKKWSSFMQIFVIKGERAEACTHIRNPSRANRTRVSCIRKIHLRRL